ncbi:hypothetical protein SBA4_3940025 [Candidatus Sulfopaludibacter sp. SbA4]|nr:hypothetical protein SBA4_3940025 [Candidatus Sulfopaludibacter sp. SbA4]
MLPDLEATGADGDTAWRPDAGLSLWRYNDHSPAPRFEGNQDRHLSFDRRKAGDPSKAGAEKTEVAVYGVLC